MESLVQDLRYALRKFRQTPGSSAVAVLTLALGIGAATATYSVVEGVLLRSLPVREPGRLADIKQILATHRGSVRGGATSSRFVFEHLRGERGAFEDVAGYTFDQPVLSGLGDAERVGVWSVSSNFFPLLGVAPALGRGFVAEEEQPGSVSNVVLSHRFWTRRFGADPGVIGRTMTLDGTPIEIVGVMPPELSYPSDADVWRSLGWKLSGPAPTSGGAQGGFWLVGRLRPGATPEQAQRELDALAARLGELDPQYRPYLMNVTPLHEYLVGAVRKPLLLMLGAVALFLLAASANVANVLLARATIRQREITVRSALGASRGRIVRQLLAEALLLATIGGAAGVLLAWWGVPALVALGGAELPRTASIGINPHVLAVAVLMMLSTGLLFGLAPALHVARGLRGETLRIRESGGAQNVGAPRNRTSDLLIALQVALTMVLLTGAGLLSASFARLVFVDPGYRSEHVVVTQLRLPSHGYPAAEDRARFVTAALERARVIPGAQAVAISTGVPLAVGAIGTYAAGAQPAEAAGSLATLLAVSPDFFRTFGIPVQRGQVFGEKADERHQGYVVSAALARQAFPDQDPIGQQITFGGGTARRIIGVVGDTRQMSIEQEPGPHIYEALSGDPGDHLAVSVRTAADIAGTTAALRNVVREIDPHLPIDRLTTMQAMISESLTRQRFYATLLGIFAITTLVVAAAGIFGLVAFGVSRRVHELGIRAALGAHRANLLVLVLRRTLLLTLLGVAVGAAGAGLATRLLESLLYGVRPTQPAVFLAAAVLLAAIALVASWLPARRALRVDPIVALRAE